MSKSLRASFLLLFAVGAAQAAALRPVAIEECFVVPEVPSVVRWKIEGGTLPGSVSYIVRDYAEKQVAAGEAKDAGASVLETALRLPQGFFEIDFPATGQRFGIVALPPATGEAEAFFAIDGALSWLVRDDAVREGLIRVARRSGIRMIRERLTWSAVQPAEDRNDWETPVKFDTLRRTCAKHGVEVLEMAHDGPAWMGRVSVYPQDLGAAARSWQALAGHWRPTWGALEVWNEPDISFGGNLPADQYVPLAKAIAYGLSEKKIDVPLVGGVMAHCNREFLDTAAENGLLDSIDAFSFHTYGRALEMEDVVAKYREWLRAHESRSLGFNYLRMPLWITECGRPWKKGPERPPMGQDAESALDITMKGIEARACGVARYFPFVYPYYEENDNNFGMMDKRATPLRSFAAYAQMIRVMRGSLYFGDLKATDKAIRRARVFMVGGHGVPHGVLAVVYTGRQDVKAAVKLALPVARVEGIDGRLLQHGPDGVPVPDGLAYVWLAGEWSEATRTVSSVDEFDSRAMRLYLLKPDPARRKEPSPIIMRYLYDPAVVEPKSEGYRIKATPAGKLPLTVRVFNLSDEPWTARLGLRLMALEEPPASEGDRPPDNERPVFVPPRSSADAKWDVDVAAAFAKRDKVKALVYLHRADLIRRANPLVMRFFGEAGLMQTLGRFQHWVRLPIQEASRWTPNIAGMGKMQIDSVPDAGWRLKVTFGEGDRWVYPFFRLPEATRLGEHEGLVIRARCHKPADVRVFLWEGDAGVGYLTPHSVIWDDGGWHVGVIRFRDFVLSGANRPDPNGRLDLDQVRRISLGMNSKAAENALEVSDLFLVSGTP